MSYAHSEKLVYLVTHDAAIEEQINKKLTGMLLENKLTSWEIDRVQRFRRDYQQAKDEAHSLAGRASILLNELDHFVREGHVP